jgi:hypothetical protein
MRVAMTLVTIGLLLGLVGLVWTMVIGIVRDDLERSRRHRDRCERFALTNPVDHLSRATKYPSRGKGRVA